MILEKEQIHRYMRHIIMPEISGPGQRKLLDSSVLVYCEDLQQSAFMLYYLTAMGIGQITCNAKKVSDSQSLLDSLKRLNPDVKVSLTDTSSLGGKHSLVIVFNAAEAKVDNLAAIKDIPFIFAAASGDKGFAKTVLQNESLEAAMAEYKAFCNAVEKEAQNTLFSYLCSCLVGAFAAIEAVKAILQTGSLCREPLYIDLWSYSFTHEKPEQKAESLINENLINKLKNARVLIVGCGGLGSPVAYSLAKMGIGKLGLVDFDIVDISNLNRQILHSTDKIGMAKVESAKAFLSELNPDIEICTYNEKFSKENAEGLIKDYDIVVDGLDNLPTRYLLNDACYFLKKPLVEAGVLAFNGLATVIVPDEGPCYRCTFPEIEDTSAIPSCSETGVLGAVPGIMGTLQAIEVVKQLTGLGETLLDKLIMIDALSAEFTKLDIYKEEACPLCGSNPTIDALRDYNFVCSSKKM
jgi:molybdopterin/thiamine biosynthesis adenylyltransferase